MRGKTKTRKSISTGRRPGLLNHLRSWKVAASIFALAAAGAVVFFVAAQLKTAFQIEDIVFSGNSHLTDDELTSLAGISAEDNLITFSSGKLYEKLMLSPWIRGVSIRKELPSRLLVQIKEAEPFALMDVKGHLFIIDEKGRMLEELRNGSIPFLPVISGVPYGKKEAASEALQLIKVIRGRGLLSEKEHIEIIARKPQDMTINLDGLVVKVGEGEYEDKLQRLVELEGEIRKIGIPVDYIDLRFENKAVVRPVNEVVR